MTIPKLNSAANNTNRVPCLEPLPANQLVMEPICVAGDRSVLLNWN